MFPSAKLFFGGMCLFVSSVKYENVYFFQVQQDNIVIF